MSMPTPEVPRSLANRQSISPFPQARSNSRVPFAMRQTSPSSSSLSTDNGFIIRWEDSEISWYRKTLTMALLAIAQLTNPGEVRDEDLLPSFLYLPGVADFPAGSLALPWDESRDYVVGRLAQKRGVENAGRLVSSAKSWLSHSAVDRTSPLLPFRAPEGVAKISPVEASRRYLEHLRQAWDAKMPDAPFRSQQVLVTVPASFDAVARELTLDAARQAGYENITLLEEPQAAFYAWLERHADWRLRVTVGDLILVVDIDRKSVV